MLHRHCGHSHLQNSEQLCGRMRKIQAFQRIFQEQEIKGKVEKGNRVFCSVFWF